MTSALKPHKAYILLIMLHANGTGYIAVDNWCDSFIPYFLSLEFDRTGLHGHLTLNCQTEGAGVTDPLSGL